MANSTLIKSLENIMRKDSGLNGDAQYIEQITWLLFLKAFDAKEMEWELKSNYSPVIPLGYRWRDWAENPEGITGEELMSFLIELFRVLKNLDISGGDVRKFAVRTIFEDVNNYMKSGVHLRQLINAINCKVNFIDAKEKHAFNELYEGMLKDLQSAGNAGEFYTPRPVTNFIVEMVNPKLEETILDPACGTGGFLTSTISHFGAIKTPDDVRKLQLAINGWEKKPLPYLLAMTNLMLHDIELPQIKHQNSLSSPLTNYTDADCVDVIVTNPPFGGSEDASVKQNFPTEYQTAETADLFVALIIKLLKNCGRCGMVLPDSFMFGDGVKNNLKKTLIETCGLHTIIRMPQVFKPYADPFTNLFFFQKNLKSEGIWFYRFDMPEGYKNFTKKKPMLDKHFDNVRKWWNNRTSIVVDGFDKARYYTAEELVSMNYNFSECCKFPEVKENILSPQETINVFRKQKDFIEHSVNDILERVNSVLKDELYVIKEQNTIKKGITDLIKLYCDFPDVLRKSLLVSAMKGELTEQKASDSSVTELLQKIAMKKAQECINKKQKASKKELLESDKVFDIPNNWAWVKLGDIVKYSLGKTPERHESKYWKSEVPWVTIADMPVNGHIVETNEKISTDAFISKFKGQLSPAGTLLMSFKLTVGKVSILDIAAVHNEAIISVFPYIDVDNILRDYLFKILPIVCSYGKTKAAVKGKTLNSRSIADLMIPLPPLEEQKRIVDKLNRILPLCE